MRVIPPLEKTHSTHNVPHVVDQTSEEVLGNGRLLCQKKLTQILEVGQRGIVILNSPA